MKQVIFYLMTVSLFMTACNNEKKEEGGDIPFIISHIADNCKWIGTGERLLPQGGSSTGKDAVNFFSG